MTLTVHSIEEEPAPTTGEPGADATEGSGTSVDLHRDVAEDGATAVEPNLAGTPPDTAQATSGSAASPGAPRKARTSNRADTTNKTGAADEATTARADPRDADGATHKRTTQKAGAPDKSTTRKADPRDTVNATQNADAPKAAATKPALTPSPKTPSKSDVILKLLKRKRGATLAELVEATGWQSHSVRGYLSGTVRKKLGLPLVSEKGADGVLRYRIAAEPK